MNRRLTALAAVAGLTLSALLPAAAHAAKPDPTKAGAKVPGTNQAITAAQAQACFVWQGSVTAEGGHRFQQPTATTFPSMGPSYLTTGVFPRPQEVRLSARQTVEPSTAGSDRYGFVVIDDGLYRMSYTAPDGNGAVDPQDPPKLTRIGGGWAYFNFLETSFYQSPDGVRPYFARSAVYGLKNGVLYRWTITNGVWKAAGSYAGYSAVKAMTLIAKTPTYDTFLANTRGGALYTIRIPVGSAKPIVKPVRTRTWQGFETLSAAACGRYGTLLLAIDKDTKYAYLYAVGHANGLSTVIQSRGRVGYLWDDRLYFRWVPVASADIANGE